MNCSLSLWLARQPATVSTLPAQGQHLLSITETARLNRIGSQKKQLEFLHSRQLLRQALTKQFSQPPEFWLIQEQPDGPPWIHNIPEGWHVSLSHSHGLCGCAISPTPVGLDLEFNRKSRNFTAISTWLFSAAEQAALRRLTDESDRRQLFYRYWTAKEAVYKASFQAAGPISLQGIDYSLLQSGTTPWTLLEATLRQFNLCIAIRQPPTDIACLFLSPNGKATPLQKFNLTTS